MPHGPPNEPRDEGKPGVVVAATTDLLLADERLCLEGEEDDVAEVARMNHHRVVSVLRSDVVMATAALSRLQAPGIRAMLEHN